jgi:hypothetical protein
MMGIWPQHGGIAMGLPIDLALTNRRVGDRRPQPPSALDMALLLNNIGPKNVRIQKIVRTGATAITVAGELPYHTINRADFAGRPAIDRGFSPLLVG